MALAFSFADTALFLNSSPQWKSSLGPGWIGTKLLGKGGFGVAGLFEYRGPPSSAPSITQIVVKMSEAQLPLFPDPQVFPKSKIDEGITLRQLAACKSQHIVRIYGGNRLGDRFGEMGEVVRIFLEYCPGGDVGRFLSGYGESPMEPLEEVDVWALFYCMALGVVVMARGTEDLKAEEWGGAERFCELVHFDLKPDNVFLGGKNRDHVRMPVAKIGDFGEAYEVKKPQYQDDRYGGLPSKRGTDYYHPPEETINQPHHPFSTLPLPFPLKGTCSNIFQIGTILNQLLLRTQLRFDDQPALSQCKPTTFNLSSKRLLNYPNHSLDLETAEIKALYSNTLLELVMECLLRPPVFRPSAIELVERTREGFEAAMETSKSRTVRLKPLPPGMEELPYIEILEHEPPPSWDVDDTTPAYLEAAHRMSQAAGSGGTPQSGYSTTGSGGKARSGVFTNLISRASTPGTTGSGVLSSMADWVATISPGTKFVTGSRKRAKAVGGGGSSLSPGNMRTVESIGAIANMDFGDADVGDGDDDDVWEDAWEDLAGTLTGRDEDDGMDSVVEKEDIEGFVDLSLSPHRSSPSRRRRTSAEQIRGRGGVMKSSPRNLRRGRFNR